MTIFNISEELDTAYWGDLLVEILKGSLVLCIAIPLAHYSWTTTCQKIELQIQEQDQAQEEANARLPLVDVLLPLAVGSASYAPPIGAKTSVAGAYAGGGTAGAGTQPQGQASTTNIKRFLQRTDTTRALASDVVMAREQPRPFKLFSPNPGGGILQSVRRLWHQFSDDLPSNANSASAENQRPSRFRPLINLRRQAPDPQVYARNTVYNSGILGSNIHHNIPGYSGNRLFTARQQRDIREGRLPQPQNNQRPPPKTPLAAIPTPQLGSCICGLAPLLGNPSDSTATLKTDIGLGPYIHKHTCPKSPYYRPSIIPTNRNANNMGSNYLITPLLPTHAGPSPLANPIKTIFHNLDWQKTNVNVANTATINGNRNLINPPPVMPVQSIYGYRNPTNLAIGSEANLEDWERNYIAAESRAKETQDRRDEGQKQQQQQQDYAWAEIAHQQRGWWEQEKILRQRELDRIIQQREEQEQARRHEQEARSARRLRRKIEQEDRLRKQIQEDATLEAKVELWKRESRNKVLTQAHYSDQEKKRRQEEQERLQRDIELQESGNHQRRILRNLPNSNIYDCSLIESDSGSAGSDNSSGSPMSVEVTPTPVVRTGTQGGLPRRQQSELIGGSFRQSLSAGIPVSNNVEPQTLGAESMNISPPALSPETQAVNVHSFGERSHKTYVPVDFLQNLQTQQTTSSAQTPSRAQQATLQNIFWGTRINGGNQRRLSYPINRPGPPRLHVPPQGNYSDGLQGEPAGTTDRPNYNLIGGEAFPGGIGDPNLRRENGSGQQGTLQNISWGTRLNGGNRQGLSYPLNHPGPPHLQVPSRQQGGPVGTTDRPRNPTGAKAPSGGIGDPNLRRENSSGASRTTNGVVGSSGTAPANQQLQIEQLWLNNGIRYDSRNLQATVENYEGD